MGIREVLTYSIVTSSHRKEDKTFRPSRYRISMSQSVRERGTDAHCIV
jgi:hypothetical protein